MGAAMGHRLVRIIVCIRIGFVLLLLQLVISSISGRRDTA
jgi:hypothetical protein